MQKYKYVILGAGPSGLAFANRLLDSHETDFLVIEKADTPGGLCRSKEVDGAPLDIGGGHFLDVKRRKVLDFLFRFMPKEEWNIYERDSRIAIGDDIINSPIEANIWQLPIVEQVKYLKTIAIAGCNLGTAMPEKFVEWIYWKLGNRIADEYMIPYNKKIFGSDLDSLGTYWLNKLPNVSFDETLMSCLERKAYGSQPAHAQFYYPKRYGYGELWNRMAVKLDKHIIYNQQVHAIDINERVINDNIKAEYIINTIPWMEFKTIHGATSSILSAINSLKYSSVVIHYHTEDMKSNAQWIYYPDEALAHHRVLVRSNFCPDSRGYWTETNLDRYREDEAGNGFCYVNTYAYPLNTVDKPAKMMSLLSELKKRSVYGLGRWGEWQHYNSDVVVELAINLADRLVNKNLTQ
ncbi:MAG: NAD(P)-binding protein [Lachnospiraceae bacterium]|nr:NAD(P)-binding protein [Lachnospiraceae bacterium]